MDLSLAYMKRKRWEARLQAVEIGKVLAELLGGKTDAGTRRRGDAGTPGRDEHTSGAALLQEMGVKVKKKTQAKASG